MADDLSFVCHTCASVSVRARDHHDLFTYAARLVSQIGLVMWQCLSNFLYYTLHICSLAPWSPVSAVGKNGEILTGLETRAIYHADPQEALSSQFQILH